MTTHVSQNGGNMEWLTPPLIVDAAGNAMGGIDLDPASSCTANDLHQIKHIFTEEINGLDKEWHGRVFINPPYTRKLVDAFATKLISEMIAKRLKQAVWLSNNSTDTVWCQYLMRMSKVTCFPNKRIKFLNPEWKPTGKPLQGQVLFGFGPELDTTRFSNYFGGIGQILRPY